MITVLQYYSDDLQLCSHFKINPRKVTYHCCAGKSAESEKIQFC